MNDEIRIRISDIVFALKKHWKLIAVTGAAGLLIGIMLTAISYLQTPLVSYSINGSFAVSSISASGTFIGNGGTVSYNDYYLAENMVPSVRYVLNSSRIVKAAIDDEKLIGIQASDIQQRLSLTQYGKTQIIDMTLVWRSPEEGLNIWNALINAGNRFIPQMLQVGTLVVINEPRAAAMGITRTGPNLAVVLTALGALAGMGYALLSVLLRPTLSNIKDVDTVLGLETVGRIPEGTVWREENGSLAEGNKNAEANESYSAATYILRNRLGRKDQHHCFYVTSTTGDEGKSMVAANIALQLSEMECRTLLIDYDTRNPDIGAMLLPETDYAQSLNALYRGEANEYDVIVKINGYLDLIQMLPEHSQIPLDGTIEDFFLSQAEKYQYMVINASPVGVVSGTLSLNQVTNNALFVVGYDTATMSDIQSAIQRMDKSGARIIGCVVTGLKGKIAQPEEKWRSRGKGKTGKLPSVHMAEKGEAQGPALVDEMLSQLNPQEESGPEDSEGMPGIPGGSGGAALPGGKEPPSLLKELYEDEGPQETSVPESGLDAGTAPAEQEEERSATAENPEAETDPMKQAEG